MAEILYLMFLLQLKHFWIDFVAQTKTELEHKGNYGSWAGLTHSFKHAIFTGLAIWIVLGYTGIPFAISMAILDLIAHYHIDYAKMRFGSKDPASRTFWIGFGLDQLAHQLTYILIIGLTVL